MPTFAVILVLLLPTATLAETYRCIGKDGRTLYTDVPCSLGAEGGAIELLDNELDYSEWRWRHELSHPSGHKSKRRAKRKQQTKGQGGESSDCRQAKRHLGVEHSLSVDRNPSRIGAARFRVKIACSRKYTIGFRCRTALKKYETEIAQGNQGAASSAKADVLEACRQ